jgi:hypothetical protein
MALLKNYLLLSRLTEQTFAIAKYDGRRLNRVVFADGSFLPATEEGFTNFYSTFPTINDPSFLARYQYIITLCTRHKYP